MSETSPVKAVLFDYGVVLSGPPDPAAWARMLTITGLSEAEFGPAYWAPRHDYDRGFHTGIEYWRAAGRHAGREFSEQQLADLMDADNALWTQVNQPMVDWALRLHAAGTPTGVLSNLGDAITDGVLARQPWLGGFDHLVWSHTLKLAKPDPEIFLAAAKCLGLPPHEILFVGDHPINDIYGAKNVGMMTAWVTNGQTWPSKLNHLKPDHILEQLSDLSALTTSR